MMSSPSAFPVYQLAFILSLLLLLYTKHVLGELDNYYYFPVCDYAGTKYPAGTIFTPQPCVQCQCNATTGYVQCSTVPCPDLGANCVQYGYDQDSCCPKCRQRGCVYKNQKYLPGAKIDVSPCQRCYCPQNGGDKDTGAPTCLNIQCPQTRCVDPETPPDTCCPVCPNGPNCWLDDKIIKEGQRIYIDKCRFCYCSDMEYIYNASRRHATCVRSFFCL